MRAVLPDPLVPPDVPRQATVARSGARRTVSPTRPRRYAAALRFARTLGLLKFLGLSVAASLAAMWLPSVSALEFGYGTPAEALEDIKSKPGVTARTEHDWIVLNDASSNTIWSITTDRHPAHSTAIKRTIARRDGQLFVEMNVRCGASKEVCDQVVAQFQQINEDIAARFQPQVQ